MFARGIYMYIWTVKCEWLVPLLAYKLLSCFSPFVFSFLPNQNVSPSTFWQQSSPTVGCISANKPLITSCFSRALTMFCFLTWNTQSRMFWQWLSLPVLLDYWSWEVWIILQVPLTLGQSQVINLIVHDRVRWAGYRLNKFHGAIQIFANVLTTQLCWLNIA